MTPKVSGSIRFWEDILQYGGWSERANAQTLAPAPGETPSGITIRTINSALSAQCAAAVQRAITDLFTNPPSTITKNQQSDFLNLCPDCAQIEMDY
jgi:hypothetical protein